MEDKKATQTGSTSANSNSQKQNSSAWSSRSRLTQREGSSEDSSAPPRETESYRLKSRACTLFLTKTEVVKYRIDQFRTSQPSRDNQKLTQNSTSSSSSSSSSLSSELLDLSKLQIQSYPASLSSLSSILTKLNLSSNSLVVLPAEIALLENLEELILDNNELVSLPKEIGKLTHLQRLHCYHNKISNLPTEIAQLSSLKRLFLGHNNIGYFPPELSALSSLQWLSLDDNNLSSIPPDISSLQSLGYLSLESNQLHSLPKEMADMRSLEFLSIVNNPNLSTLPEYFANFALLKDLRSDNCFLLPKHIADRHEGREILDYLVNVLVRWDLNFNEKAHWELDQNSSKCFKCNSSFTFTKRRHHCRLCGLIFCNRDCDITCEIPGITLPGRCCVDCFSYLDPLSPVNLYRQQQEKKMKAKMRVIGFEDGDENLPLDEKIGKIKGQIKELSDLIVLELNTKDGLIKMLSILDHAMAEDTKQQIIQSDQTLDELNEALNQLRQILHSLTS